MFNAPLVEEFETQDDLDRILALPRRVPIRCERDPLTRRYAPETEALVAAVTARFARPRLSCSCRPRLVSLRQSGALVVSRVLPAELPPEPPLVTAVAALVADELRSVPGVCHPTAYNHRAAAAVLALRPGEEVLLEAADDHDLGGHDCIKELSAPQAWVLDEGPQVGGILGHLGVGSGKSAVLIIAPLAFTETRLAVILFESNQRAHYKSQYRRFREHFRVPSITFDDGDGHTVPGTPQVHLVTYAKLGYPPKPGEAEVLDGYNPNFFGFDEAHRMTGANNSAGRRRVRRYFTKKIIEREQAMARGEVVTSRAVFSLPMSGTLEDKSVADTQPLGVHSLGTGSPLPLDGSVAKKWSLVMDPGRRPDRVSDTARRLHLAFAGRSFTNVSVSVAAALDDDAPTPEREVRLGFQRWRAHTRGVISAHAVDCDAAIYFRERKLPPLSAAIRAELRRVREEGVRPDGDLLVTDALRVQVTKDVASGYYNYWAFPGIPCEYAKVHAGQVCPSGAPKCAGCAIIDRWFVERKAYGRELRKMLANAYAHLDSPKLCANAAARAWADPDRPSGDDVYCVDCKRRWGAHGCESGAKSHMPGWQARSWPGWAAVKDAVPHEERVKWLDDFLARDAAKWALAKPGVVWCASVALGEKIAELSGLPWYSGGKNAEAAIRAENGKRSIILSMDAWGWGLDCLQLRFNRQLWTHVPTSNKVGEQVLGRLHRRGQRADVVHVDYYKHIPEISKALRQMRALADFNWTMTKNEQKVRLADFGGEGDDEDDGEG